MAVVIADQRASRRHPDQVPAALAALDAVEVLLPFERTAGDEIQAPIAEAAAVLDTLELLTRHGDWRLGIGLGAIDQPLPDSTREARGSAYSTARTAIEAAHRSPVGLAVRLADDVGGADYRDRVHDWEGELWLLRSLLSRRSEAGWQVSALARTGLPGREIAERLAITPSAVSQRLAAAAHVEGERGRQLTIRSLDRLQEIS